MCTEIYERNQLTSHVPVKIISGVILSCTFSTNLFYLLNFVLSEYMRKEIRKWTWRISYTPLQFYEFPEQHSQNMWKIQKFNVEVSTIGCKMLQKTGNWTKNGFPTMEWNVYKKIG